MGVLMKDVGNEDGLEAYAYVVGRQKSMEDSG